MRRRRGGSRLQARAHADVPRSYSPRHLLPLALRIEAVCSELAGARRCFRCADRISRIGTWRDAERPAGLGVNDSRAAEIPPVNLVRLAASAWLRPERGIGCEIAAAPARRLSPGLADPRPTLLDEQETWMRRSSPARTRIAELREGGRRISRSTRRAPRLPACSGANRRMPRWFPPAGQGRRQPRRPRFVAIAAWRAHTTHSLITTNHTHQEPEMAPRTTLQWQKRVARGCPSALNPRCEANQAGIPVARVQGRQPRARGGIGYPRPLSRKLLRSCPS